MHAVGADQEVAFGGGAVGEIGDDRLVAAILDLDQALVEIERDAGAPGLVDQHLVQRGAADIDRGLAETPRHVAVDRAEPSAFLRIEVEGLRDRAAADQLVREPDLVHHMHAVRRDLEAAADALGVGPGFVDRGFDAGAAQQDRGNGPGDAGADDQGLAGTMGHGLLRTLPW